MPDGDHQDFLCSESSQKTRICVRPCAVIPTAFISDKVCTGATIHCPAPPQQTHINPLNQHGSAA